LERIETTVDFSCGKAGDARVIKLYIIIDLNIAVILTHMTKEVVWSSKMKCYTALAPVGHVLLL
jgi:hypothetical protein